jgi:hypothetical protein
MANLLTALGLLLNTLLFIATAVLALYAYLQWRAVDDTLVQVKAQTPAVLLSAQAAADSAKLAKQEADSADATTRATLEEMKKQSIAEQRMAAASGTVAATAVKQLDVSSRPMVELSDERVDYLAINSFMNITYGLALRARNKGHNPATDAAVLSDIIMMKPGEMIAPRAELSRTCHKSDKTGPLAGVAIGSDGGDEGFSQLFLAASRGLSFRDALTLSVPDPETGQRQLDPLLTICVLYRSPISSEVHHIGMMYSLIVTVSRNSASEVLSDAIPKNAPIIINSDRITIRKFDVINGLID